MKKCLRNMSLVALNVDKEGLKGNPSLVIRLQLLEFGQAQKGLLYCMFIEIIII